MQLFLILQRLFLHSGCNFIFFYLHRNSPTFKSFEEKVENLKVSTGVHYLHDTLFATFCHSHKALENFKNCTLRVTNGHCMLFFCFLVIFLDNIKLQFFRHFF